MDRAHGIIRQKTSIVEIYQHVKAKHIFTIPHKCELRIEQRFIEGSNKIIDYLSSHKIVAIIC